MKNNFKHNLSRLRKMVNPEQTRAEYYRSIGKTPDGRTTERPKETVRSRKKSPAIVREQATEELRAKIERLQQRRARYSPKQ